MKWRGQIKPRYGETYTFTTRSGDGVRLKINGQLLILDGDTYSVRWTGQIEALYDEEYTFYTQSDDGVRLWIDGQSAIDDWTARPERENQGKIVLEAGKKYDIKLEYFEEALTASAQLLWSSPSQTKEVVPSSQLIAENPDCAPITVEWSNVLDISQPGAYTFDTNLPFGATFTVNGETFNTTPEDNSFSLLLPAGAIDFQLQLPAISPCDPPWSDTEENDGGPPIDIGILEFSFVSDDASGDAVGE